MDKLLPPMTYFPPGWQRGQMKRYLVAIPAEQVVAHSGSDALPCTFRVTPLSDVPSRLGLGSRSECSSAKLGDPRHHLKSAPRPDHKSLAVDLTGEIRLDFPVSPETSRDCLVKKKRLCIESCKQDFGLCQVPRLSRTWCRPGVGKDPIDSRRVLS
jgi:hypothetical protein